jgi:hypothetical protein
MVVGVWFRTQVLYIEISSHAKQKVHPTHTSSMNPPADLVIYRGIEKSFPRLRCSVHTIYIYPLVLETGETMRAKARICE